MLNLSWYFLQDPRSMKMKKKKAMESLIESSRKILNHLMDYLQRAVFDCGNRVPVFSILPLFFLFLCCWFSFARCFIIREMWVSFFLCFFSSSSVPWSVFYADALWIQEKWYGQTFNFSCFMAVWLSKWKLSTEAKSKENEKVFLFDFWPLFYHFTENKKKVNLF